jgi:methylmalonyl-CoA/ethylmalonyl-CoA epimerase
MSTSSAARGGSAPSPPEPSVRLAHLGVIVHRIDAALSLYARLGLAEAGRMVFPQERIRIAFIPVEGARIELMEPLEAAGPLGRFLAGRGEGIHHLAFEVPDLEAAMARVRDAGGRLIDETPRQGSEGTRVAFVHPASTHGVLTELVERTRQSRASIDSP